MVTNISGRTPGALLCTFAAAVAMFFSAGAVAGGPPQQLIVKFKEAPGLQANSNASTRAQQVLETLGNQHAVQFERGRRLAIGADIVRVGRGNGAKAAIASADYLTESELEAMAAELAQNPDVEYAEVDRLLKPLATPNDSRYNEQWHYFEATGGMRLPAAWDQSTGAGIRVAVIDTGYRPHADLVGNIIGGYDFISDNFVANDGGGRDSDARDPGDAISAGECGNNYPPSDQGSSWHGTHVAGTIAAVTNNNTGVAGIAYDAQVVPLRVLGKCGGLTSDIADAIVWAAGGSVSGVPSNSYPAQVINMSLGGGGSCSSTTQSAINSARSNGAVVVVAAGNENTNASNSNPANCSGVVTIAATNRNGGRSYYSNYGSVVDVAAPGGELTQSTSVNGVLSTLNSGSTSPGSDSYAFYQGTSMAAPHAAGAAALVMSANPDLTPDEVESILKSTARSFPSTCSQCGTGIIDANAAVTAALGGGGDPGDNALENGVAETGLSAGTGSEVHFTLEVPAGATDLSFQISGGSGDADLYVRYGSAPTTSQYDCRPYQGGNSESCNISNVQEGTYYVMVRAYSSFSNVSLVGSYTEPSGGGGGDDVLENGVAKSNLSGASGGELRFTMNVPAGASGLSFAMSGGSGDADLYVKFGSAPTTSSYDCRPYKNGNSETCNISTAQAGTYHVMIRGYSSFSGVSLIGSYSEGGSNPPDPNELQDGVAKIGLSGASGSTQYYTMQVPSGASSLSFSMSGGTGDADMYVRFGSQPTTSSYDCRPYKNGNNETCSFSSPQAGTWHVMIRGYSSFSGVSLTGNY